MDLAEATDLLYGVLPSEFVAQRDELVRAARADGNAALAVAVGQLRKPTVGAWLSNLLARQEQVQLEQLVDLGALLREAQGALDGTQLRELSRQRGQLVAALAALARRHAADLGQPVGEAALREVEATLTAALSDAQAAELVLGGALTTSLEVVGGGFGGTGAAAGFRTTGASAGSRAASGPQSTPTARPTAVRPRRAALHAVKGPAEGGPGSRPDDEAAAAVRAAVDEAERLLAQARLREAEAERAIEDARAEELRAVEALADADALQDELAAELADLQRRQEEAHEQARQARTRLDVARRSGRAADRGLDDARAAVADAEADLDAARG